MLGLLGWGLVIQLLLPALQLPFELIEWLLLVEGLVVLEGWPVLPALPVLVLAVVVVVVIHLLLLLHLLLLQHLLLLLCHLLVVLQPFQRPNVIKVQTQLYCSTIDCLHYCLCKHPGRLHTTVCFLVASDLGHLLWWTNVDCFPA